MKSVIELELELSQAKLAKMTSTVKQLGTKLKDANLELVWEKRETSFLRADKKELLLLKKKIAEAVLTPEELGQRVKQKQARAALLREF